MGTSLDWEAGRARIEELAALDYNFDAKMFHDTKDKSGWNIDRYLTPLGDEPPGMPVDDGPFHRVKAALRLYQFPDPKLIRAVFDPDSELAGRNMLLIAQFAGFEFHFGVRVTAVVDEVRQTSTGDKVAAWGYSYRTLKGHFEVGEIRFEVQKNLRSGVVSFEIDAFSKPDRIPNFFFRTGFKIFGRPLQKYFAYSSMRRMRRLARRAPPPHVMGRA